jgi:hypothetical protein
MQNELSGLKEWLDTETASRAVNIIKKVGWYKGEVGNPTIAQYTKLTGKKTLTEYSYK